MSVKKREKEKENSGMHFWLVSAESCMKLRRLQQRWTC